MVNLNNFKNLLVCQSCRKVRSIISGRTIGRFLNHKSGNIATSFALALVPMLLAVGLAVDFSRAISMKARLANALDAAGLAAGATPGLTEAQTKALVNSFFAENYPNNEIGVLDRIDVTVGQSSLKLSAYATVDTLLVRMIGVNSLNVSVDSEITKESKGLEVALVLDNTGSMNSNGKIDALRTSATELINILYGPNASSPKLFVSLVPFSTGVNVNSPGVFSMGWIDQNAQARYHGATFDKNLDATNVNHLQLFNWMQNATWRGCVEARAEPFDLDDTAPTLANPDTLWVPYLFPDDSDNKSYAPNNYASDGLPGYYSDTQRLRNGTAAHYQKSVTVDEVPVRMKGPNKGCPEPIIPLTNSKATLLNAISAMKPWGYAGTNIPMGLSWGWRVLSPTAPYTEGKSYSDSDNNKAIILLTDGKNTLGSGWYSGYGYDWKQRLASTHSASINTMNSKVSALCSSAKSQGIRIYTITFQMSDSTLQSIFKSCASSPDLFFNSPSNTELQNAFKAIAQDLSNLRISK